LAIAAVFGVVALQAATLAVHSSQGERIEDMEQRVAQVARNLDVVASVDADDLERHERWLERLDRQAGHTCIAPCTVVLGKALEDEWVFDYGWRADGQSVVGVEVRR
jgi:hypothetical protein